MNWILRKYINKFYEIYFNDILIYFDSIKKHMKNVKLIFNILWKYKLIIFKFKSQLFTDYIKFLNHYISLNDIKLVFIKLNKIINFSISYFINDIKNFLNFVNYFIIFDFFSDLTD